MKYEVKLIEKKIDQFTSFSLSQSIDRMHLNPLLNTYRMDVRFGCIFSCHEEALPHAIECHKQKVNRHIFGPMSKLIGDIHCATYAGDRDAILKACQEMQKYISEFGEINDRL